MGNPSALKTDEELMLEYQEGNDLAFEVLYSRYSRKVYGFLHKKIYDKNTLDDIFQGTFMKLHQSRAQYNPEYPFTAWLFTICRSMMTDHLRKVQRNKEDPSSDSLVFNSLATPTENQTSQIIDPAPELDQLPNQQKAAVKMRYYEDLDFEAIAKNLNTSSSNARKLVSRGILELKALMKGRQS